MENSDKALIELDLYPRVKILIESQYETEEINNKPANGIIFKNKEKAILLVRDEIIKFSKERKVDMFEVTYILMNILEMEKEKKLNPNFKEKYQEIKDIVLMIDDIERY